MNDDISAEVFLKLVDLAGPIGAFVGLLLLLLFFLFKNKLAPKLTRTQLSWVLIGIIALTVVGALSPIVVKFVMRVKTIDVILRASDRSLVQIPFTLKYRLPDRGVIDVEGKEGIAAIRGIPIDLDSLNVVDIQCTGWTVAKKGRHAVDDQGEVTIIMKKSGPIPPPDDAMRPDPSPFEPTAEQLAAPPKVAAEDVTLHYINSTGKPITLVLHPYFVPKDADAWKLRPKWLDFPMDEAEGVFDKFEKGNGHFGCWVQDANGTHWPLGAHNLFIADEVWLNVLVNPESRERPYKVEISTEPSKATTN